MLSIMEINPFIENFKLSTKYLLLKELRRYYEDNLKLLYNREFEIIEDNATYLEESLLILREITHYVKEDYLSDYNYINLCFKLDEILEEISLEDTFSLFNSINFFVLEITTKLKEPNFRFFFLFQFFNYPITHFH